MTAEHEPDESDVEDMVVLASSAERGGQIARMILTQRPGISGEELAGELERAAAVVWGKLGVTR